MNNRAMPGGHRLLLSTVAAALLLVGAAPVASAQGVSDADLRGYKGGLVEIQLKSGNTVHGVLYNYSSSQLELATASGDTVLLHRSWIVSLKAAAPGAQKSPRSAFPAHASEAYRKPAPPPPRETPRETPPSESPSTQPRPASTTEPNTPPKETAPLAKPGEGPLAKGLVFQLRIGGNLLTIVGGGIASWLNSSFLFGYKLDRLVIGLGLEMTYSDDALPNADPDPTESSTALVLFQPTLEYYLAIKSPLALYMTVGLHVGFANNHQDPGKDVTNAMIGFHAGLGMRYFFHPRFAVGVEGGLRGVWMMIKNDEDVTTDDENTGVMSLYGAATLTAIW